jgi:hypothetical protein
MTIDGKDASGAFRYTDTFVKRQGRLAGHRLTRHLHPEEARHIAQRGITPQNTA